MNTTLNTPRIVDTTAVELKTVRAGVNEKAFFESMKHLFANRFSLVGELMQNARRAGATKVGFALDVEAKTLQVADDGCGICEFQDLVQLCTSGWSDEIKLTDKPFGMGLFSYFFACDRVTFRSNGRILSLTLDDIVNKRLIAEQADPNGWLEKGSLIELAGLKAEMLKEERTWESGLPCVAPALISAIHARAKGFPIPVHVNGIECARPHAQDALKGQNTEVGFASLLGVHFGDSPIQMPHGVMDGMNCYLQGLPIGKSGRAGGSVVHLDSVKFIARMPDRNTLYDEDEQLKVVTQCLTEVVRQHLCGLKKTMDGATFVDKYWDACVRFACEHLLEDIPWIPADILSAVHSVGYQSEETTFPFSRNKPVDLVSLEEIRSGGVKVWRHAPSCTDPDMADEEGSQDPVLLRIMYEQDICGLDVNKVPKGHWIHALTPSTLDFVVEVRPVGSVKTVWHNCGNVDLTLDRVQSVNVRLTSEVDETFVLEAQFEDGWVMVFDEPENGSDEISQGRNIRVCIVDQDQTCGEAVDAFSDFRGEFDRFDEDWRNREVEDWTAVVEALFGGHIEGAVTRALENSPARPLADQADQIAVVSCFTRRDYNGRVFVHPSFQVEKVDEAFWKKMATEFADQASQEPSLTLAQRLQQAFQRVTNAGGVEPAKEPEAT